MKKIAINESGEKYAGKLPTKNHCLMQIATCICLNFW